MKTLRDPAVALALAILTVVAFSGVLALGFTGFDDDEYVTDNPHVRAGLTTEGVAWAFTTGRASNWHPLTWLSHMLDVEIFGLRAAGHHGVSLALHVANTVLLYVLLLSMTGARWRSALVAALFGVHPLHVESVAWIAERKDLLSTLLWLAATAAWVGHVRRPSVGRYALAVALLGAGLMAKPMLVGLPATLLLLDLWPLRRLRLAGARDGISVLRAVGEKLPLLVLAGASAVVTYLVQRAGGAVTGLDAIPADARLANAAVSYVAYALKTFRPEPLAFFYPHPALLPGGGPAAWLLAGAVALLLVATAAALAAWRTRPWLTTGWLWYLVTLVPVIGIVQVGVQSMADRYTYVPLIGLFVIVAWAAGEVAERLGRPARAALVAGAIAALAACVVVTRQQVPVWTDGMTLCTHAVEVTRDNYPALNNLGVELASAGRLDDAERRFREALRIRPSYAAAHDNLGHVLVLRGRLDAALAEFEQATRLDPREAQPWNNLGNALLSRGRTAEAIDAFEHAVRSDPDYVRAHRNLALALAREGRLSEALAHLDEAVRLRPDLPEAWAERAGVLEMAGRPRDAIADYRRALTLRPGWPEVRRRLATLAHTPPPQTP